MSGALRGRLRRLEAGQADRAPLLVLVRRPGASETLEQHASRARAALADALQRDPQAWGLTVGAR